MWETETMPIPTQDITAIYYSLLPSPPCVSRVRVRVRVRVCTCTCTCTVL